MIKKLISLTKELDSGIKEFQHKNQLVSFNEAARQLIKEGLNAVNK